MRGPEVNEVSLVGFKNRGIVSDRVIGLRVRTLRDFFQLPQGSEGTIMETYNLSGHRGVLVKWDCGLNDGFGMDETHFLEVIGNG